MNSQNQYLQKFMFLNVNSMIAENRQNKLFPMTKPEIS